MIRKLPFCVRYILPKNHPKSISNSSSRFLIPFEDIEDIESDQTYHKWVGINGDTTVNYLPPYKTTETAVFIVDAVYLKQAVEALEKSDKTINPTPMIQGLFNNFAGVIIRNVGQTKLVFLSSLTNIVTRLS